MQKATTDEQSFCGIMPLSRKVGWAKQKRSLTNGYRCIGPVPHRFGLDMFAFFGLFIVHLEQPYNDIDMAARRGIKRNVNSKAITERKETLTPVWQPYSKPSPNPSCCLAKICMHIHTCNRTTLCSIGNPNSTSRPAAGLFAAYKSVDAGRPRARMGSLWRFHPQTNRPQTSRIANEPFKIQWDCFLLFAWLGEAAQMCVVLCWA